MNGEGVVVDSNVLIDLLKGDEAARDAIRGLSTLVSFITEVEVLAWPKSTPADMVNMSILLGQTIIVPYGPSIKTATINLRRTTKMKLPDCFVAATALVSGAPLITRDKGFKKVAHLVELRLI